MRSKPLPFTTILRPPLKQKVKRRKKRKNSDEAAVSEVLLIGSPASGGVACSSPQEAAIGFKFADFGILRVLERGLDILRGVLPVADHHR